jgi:2-hydroxy-6-oxonona-2,4-dienedioate hydrolase
MGPACSVIWPRVRGLRIHTRVSTAIPADHRAIVLVHGLGVSARYMLPTLGYLAPYLAVYAPDLPGFGESDKPTYPLDIPDLADVLAEWLGVVGLERASFLGNSFGCQVIADLAARFPELIDCLILTGPTIDSRARSMPRQLWRGALDLIHEPWSLWPILAHDYFETGTRKIFKTFRYALRDRVEEKCRRVKAPTLIVRGSQDRIAAPRWAEELRRLIPSARLAIIPGAAHAINFSAPEQLARLTREFLNSHRER